MKTDYFFEILVSNFNIVVSMLSIFSSFTTGASRALTVAVASMATLTACAQKAEPNIGDTPRQAVEVEGLQNAYERLLTRRGVWIYKWAPTPGKPVLKVGEIHSFGVRYFPNGSYVLTVRFAGQNGSDDGEVAVNKGLWSISQSLYAAIITVGPSGQLNTPIIGSVSTIRSFGPDSVAFTSVMKSDEMVLTFKPAE